MGRRKSRVEIVREVFSAWGRKGGRNRAKALSAARRRAIARGGAAARWAKRKKPRR
jgi:hypothetical protein